MQLKRPSVYILASHYHGTLYTGVTSDLVKRIWEHKNGFVAGFCQKYQVHRLVWHEMHESMYTAITSEKNIKKWKRNWKVRLIEENNPDWHDLYDTIC